MLLRNSLLAFLIHFVFQGHARDTLQLSLQQADNIFLKNNFYLLAGAFNIDAQKAQILQAKLYPNPFITAEFNAYDPENNKWLHSGREGQKGFQIEQLVVLGGKRKSEIEMAKTNVRIAEIEFEQLVVNLKYRLHTQLYFCGLQQLLLKKYEAQLSLLDSLLHSYQVQVDKGNIALKELVRLKGTFLKLNNDRAELFREYLSVQSELQKLLQVSSFIKFDFSEEDILKYTKPVSLSELVSTAQAKHPGLLLSQQNWSLAQQSLQYQKKLAIPDVNLFASYDQRSGAFLNQINAGITIPIPVWNRNTGNIKSAWFKWQMAEFQKRAVQNEIDSDIKAAYLHYMQAVAEYQKAASLYNQDFEITTKGMMDNFQKRNVSIVEFVDFFETYYDVISEITKIKIRLVASAEELNRLTATDLYQ
jgi:cobalt-zinc-cadmium efflux system outer membrane protein